MQSRRSVLGWTLAMVLSGSAGARAQSRQIPQTPPAPQRPRPPNPNDPEVDPPARPSGGGPDSRPAGATRNDVLQRMFRMNESRF